MYWYIAFGGALGSVTRAGVSAFMQRRFDGGFPWGTWSVNVVGSFLLGLVMEYALATPAISQEARALLTTGFCGGFTTFSTFNLETARLLEDGDYRRALIYLVSSLSLGLVAMFAGLISAREILALRRAA